MKIQNLSLRQDINMTGQFFITEDLGPIDGFDRILMRNGHSFYSRGVKTTYNDQHDILLAGYAFQTLSDAKNPEQEVIECNSEKSKERILKSEFDWCGRYILIVDGVIYTDAAALYPVFYSKLYISSNLAFIAATKESAKIYHPEKGIIMNWMPGPMTHYEGIYRVLPSQAFSIWLCHNR